MILRHDPFASPELVRRVYSYVAYRIGPGQDAEDVTSTVFERAIRFRSRYDPRRGTPLVWLLAIARRAVADHRRPVHAQLSEPMEPAAPGDLAEDSVRRLTVEAAVARLAARDRDLIAMRYGADMSARDIATVLGVKTNAVEVALHRALGRLREDMRGGEEGGPSVLHSVRI